MGVLRCGRSDCENIMCDRLILEGEMYICEECYEELRRWWNDMELAGGLSKREVRKLIEDFMHSPVGSFDDPASPDEIHEEFERLTSR